MAFMQLSSASCHRHALAVGLESGEIMIHVCQLTAPYWSAAVVVDPAYPCMLMMILNTEPPSIPEEGQKL